MVKPEEKPRAVSINVKRLYLPAVAEYELRGRKTALPEMTVPDGREAH
jgi:hypothetical protein